MKFEIKEYRGNFLSRFRTFHTAPNFAEITSAEAATEAFNFAKKNSLSPFVLGGGSNVFFKNSKIKSLVLKTELPKKIEYIGNDLFKVSASVRMIDLLNALYKQGRQAPYFLASAPCQIGGAIAMNAGTGKRENKCIFDFLESVEYADIDGTHSKTKNSIFHEYRHTEFSDKNVFICSAIFRFPETHFDENPIKARLDWAKENQDLSVPNCGSLCNKYNAPLMKIARFIFAPFPAGMSQKKLNWTYNKAKSPFCLKCFLGTLKLLHKLFGKELKFEIKMVD